MFPDDDKSLIFQFFTFGREGSGCSTSAHRQNHFTCRVVQTKPCEQSLAMQNASSHYDTYYFRVLLEDLTNSTSTNEVEEEEEDSAGEEVVLSIVIAFLVALLVRLIAGFVPKRVKEFIPLPYTAILLLCGIAVGAIVNSAGPVKYATAAVKELESISPTVLFAVFLPALIMPSGLSLEWHVVRRTLDKSLTLAFLGTLFNGILIALVVKYVLPYGWEWSESLLISSILAATDPVAVVSIMESAAASVKLSTVVNGESLMNDGSAFVLFQIFFRWAGGGNLSAGWIVGFLFKAVLGSPALGIVWGLALTLWILLMYGDGVAEVAATLTASYALWIVSDEILSMSGVLALVAFSVLFGTIGKDRLSSEAQAGFQYFWEFIDWAANSIIFFLIGLIIAIEIQEIGSSEVLESKDWGYAVLLWVFLLIIRFLMVIVFFPILQHGHYGLNWKDCLVLSWAGLRGAVGLTLSLIVYLSSDIEDSMYRGKQLFFVAFMAFATLLLQGSTTSLLLKKLGYFDLTPIQKTTMRATADLVSIMASKHIQRAQNRHNILQDADWDQVRMLTDLKITHCIDDRPSRKGGGVATECSKYVEESSASKDDIIRDLRRRFLLSVISHYRSMFYLESIDPASFELLLGTTEAALDRVSSSLQSWQILEENLSYINNLRHKTIFQYIGQKIRFASNRARHGRDACTAAAFVFAHFNARKDLKAFVDLEILALAHENKQLLISQKSEQFLYDMDSSTENIDFERLESATGSNVHDSLAFGEALQPFWTMEENELDNRKVIFDTEKSIRGGTPSLVKRVANLQIMKHDEIRMCLNVVLDESREEERKAEQYVARVEGIREDSIRQFLTVSQTIAILKKQEELLREMEKQGLLEKREYSISMETIECRIKRLHFKNIVGA